MRITKPLSVILVFLQGCVFVPRTTTTYDEQCKVETRQMRLETAQLGAIGGCTNRDCAYTLVAIGAVAAASAP